MSQTMDAALEAGRDALRRHAWTEAFALLTQADTAGALSPDGLESLAEAAFWTAHPDEAISARERAYAAYVASGDRRRASRVALQLMRDSDEKRRMAVAERWFARAEKLLEGDEDCPEYGWLCLFRSLAAYWSGRHDDALPMAVRATDLGSRFADRDLQAAGVMAQGMTRVSKGEVAPGMALIDEATMAAVSGELSVEMTGIVYCSTIDTCRGLADYRRASEWTEAAERWCERQSITGFPGICRVRRAEIMALRGAWAKAEQEARRACDELTRYGIGSVVASGFYEIGEIRLRMGDLVAAEEAFRQAHEMGMAPEPGLSLLRLAEGNVEAASASLKRALANEQGRLARARLLPAEVEVALAAGDRDRARAAAAELETIATDFGTQALVAMARSAGGALALAEDDAAAAEARLRAALQLWQDLEAPYEAAKVRVLLAATCRAEGDDAAARLELQAAKATFERLGARRDAAHVAELLGGEVTSTPITADRVTKTFLFTDIVRSTNLIEAIGDEAWKDLLRWHDDTLRSLVAEHRGEEIRHQGDGLVVSFAAPTDALDCAVAIQRKLVEHRRAHGFAPQVRIGMHTAEASRHGLDYAGIGIHAAARVAALAGPGEIVASAATVGDAPSRFKTLDARSVMLKGIADAVEIATIDWR